MGNDRLLVVEKFSQVNALCVGDVMLDCFVDGGVRRISPESPVPVFSYGKRAIYPGGAANVARNIAALGARCTLIGAIGNDEPGHCLASSLKAVPNVRSELFVCDGRLTTEKTRYVSQGQHMIRIDHEVDDPLPTGVEHDLLERITQIAQGHDVLVLSDYAKGVLSDPVIRAAIAAARDAGIPVVVDPKSPRLSRYSGATVITPNAKEIEAATGIDPIDDASAAHAALSGMKQALSDAVLVTRASKGMTLVRRDSDPLHIPSRAREVFDVVGAGDTVLATLAVALGAGNGLDLASRVANVAAGIAVGRHGTATVSQSELIEALTSGGQAFAGLRATKVLGRADLGFRVRSWRNDGLRVGFTNGCFDVLHLGHIRLLQFCRERCDRLVVGLNSDASVRRLKGPNRPVNAEEDRAEVLAALNDVDAVVLFNEDTPQALIEAIRPHVLVKGADYRVEDIVGFDFVLAEGGQVLRFPLVPGKSSTDIIKRGVDLREAAP